MKIEYTKPNGLSSYYEVKEIDGIKISIDENEPLWAEKYRPRIVEDLIIPEKIEKSVKEIIKTNTIPNLLFYSATGGCVDKETEFMTQNGWKRISEFKEGDKVLSWDENGNTFFDYPLGYTKHKQNKFIHIKSKFIDQMVSFDHNMAVLKNGKYQKIKAEELYNEHLSKQCGANCQSPFNFNPPERKGIELTDDEIRLMVAFIADGTIMNKDKSLCRISVKREYKKERLRELLTKVYDEIDERTYEKEPGYSRFYFVPPILTKSFDHFWGCSKHQLEVIVDEIEKWDGGIDKRTGNKKFRTSIKDHADFIQYAMQCVCDTYVSIIASDRVGEVRKHQNGKLYEVKSKEYTVLVTNTKKLHYSFDNRIMKHEERMEIVEFNEDDTYEYCFTMPNGNWVARRNNKIFLTHNSGKDSIISVIKTQLDITMLTINASLERGIDVIKNKVTNFSVSNSVDGTHKVLYLTEAGGLTNLALDSLKSLIEEHSSRVSFIMTTNSMTNITHALQSRFQFFDMNTIPYEERKPLAIKTFKRLCAILKNEGIEFNPKDVQILLKRYFPSYRELMFALQQNVHNGKFEISQDTNVTILNDIIKYINNKDYQSLVKISEKVNYTQFSNEMNNRLYNGLLKDTSYIPGFIDALNKYQDSIVKRVPFMNISFLVFCNELIRNGIQLNEV